MWDITIYPLRGPVSSLTFVPFFNRCGTTTKSTPHFGASVLTGTPPHVYPLQGTARRLTHRPVSGSHTIYNAPNPPLANIVLFGLSFSDFPLQTRFKALRGSPNIALFGLSFSDFPLQTRFKALRGSPKGKIQRGQYLLAVDPGRYSHVTYYSYLRMKTILTNVDLLSIVCTHFKKIARDYQSTLKSMTYILTNCVMG